MIDPEVQAVLDSLEGRLNTAYSRIRELEDSYDAHHGLDNGSDEVDWNVPHRNLSVDTIESGGGATRQDLQGMQVRTAGSNIGTIYFVDEFRDDLDGYSSSGHLGYLLGNVDESSQQAFLYLLVQSAADRVAGIQANASTGDAYSARLYAHAGSENASVEAFVNTGTGLTMVDIVGQLRLDDIAADPAVLADGAIWYRTDLDRIRLRASGVTTNLATEAFASAEVTTHTGDTSDAHDASSISVLDAGGYFTGIDVEAALQELGAAAGGGMSLIVKEADETISTNAVLQNDDALLFAIAANAVYQFEGVLFIESGVTPDFQFTFVGPAGAVGSFAADVFTTSIAYFANVELATAIAVASAGTRQTIRFWGGIKNAGTAGNVTLQWAQGTSDAGNTTVHAGSYIKYQLES